MVKGTCCSSRGPKIVSESLHEVAYNACNSSSGGSDGLLGYLHVGAIDIHKNKNKS